MVYCALGHSLSVFGLFAVNFEMHTKVCKAKKKRRRVQTMAAAVLADQLTGSQQSVMTVVESHFVASSAKNSVVGLFSEVLTEV